MLSTIDPTTFVADVRPLLERNDLQGLVAFLNGRWNVTTIAQLLHRPDADARKVSLLCLALVGTADFIPSIAEQLASSDPTFNQLAEHALWSIWFRSGPPKANFELCQGAKQLSCKNLEAAAEHFDRAIEIAPTFAEPYNQRSIVRYMQDQYEQSIGDCRRAVRLMPSHFGAWAGMGHCFLQSGQLDHALRAYERAIAINPHLHEIAQAAGAIRGNLGFDRGCSGVRSKMQPRSEEREARHEEKTENLIFPLFLFFTSSRLS